MRIFVSSAFLVAMLATCNFAQALGTVTASSTAPVINGADIAQLNTTGAFDADGDRSDIWDDRPAQGQTFTTSSSPGKFVLDAITLQSRNAELNRDFAVRIGTISGTNLVPIRTEVGDRLASFVVEDYITFALESPLDLQPNTLYGFDWATPDTGGFITNSNADSLYSGGSAYSSGDDGIGVAAITLHNDPNGLDRTAER